jgi:adenylate kinase
MYNAENILQIKQWLGSGSINLFGSPFAGKDTQGRKLSELLDCPLLGGGDILRKSVIPERVKEIMQSGALIPTEDYLEIVLPYLSQKDFAGKPLVLSSVGRWHGEEDGVLQATTASEHPLRAVVYLKLAEEATWRRWQAAHSHSDRGMRADDTEEAFGLRLEEFRNKTLPVIDFYRQKGLLVEVDGNLEPEAVTREILDRLSSLAAAG